MQRKIVVTLAMAIAFSACDSPPPTDATAPQQQALEVSSGPIQCVQNVLCVIGDHWDPTQCKCVPDACISQAGGPCGGFTTHPCTCAPDLTCVPNPIADLPGTCEPKRCCPVGWDMYKCKEGGGGVGLACHNPKLGCPSSPVCGVGCDFEVNGRCPVCDPHVCPKGEVWDFKQCKCIEPCSTAADCHGPLPALCRVCSDGTTGCAHWACTAGACEVAYCK